MTASRLPSQNLFVVVTGLPAAGKSTLAIAIAAALDLRLIDKDEILESLFETRGIGNAEWRSKLSRAADEQLRDRARACDGAVIASWWRHPESDSDSGTPTEWLPSLRGEVIEVHCACRPEIAAARFEGRNRHPGHLDVHRDRDGLLATFRSQALLGPLGVGRLIEVHTETTASLSKALCAIDATRSRS